MSNRLAGKGACACHLSGFQHPASAVAPRGHRCDAEGLAGHVAPIAGVTTMALITCNECGNQVSGAAKTCPQCGAKGKALTGSPEKKHLGTRGKLAIAGIVGALAIANVATNKNNPPSAQEQADNEQDRTRTTNIVLYAKSLRAAARSPGSVVFERVLANPDGTLTCFKYQAQNGFGGTNREWAAFTPAGGQNRGAAIKIICQDKAMEDVTERALLNLKLFD